MTLENKRSAIKDGSKDNASPSSAAGICSLAATGKEKSRMRAALLVPPHSNQRRGRGNAVDGNRPISTGEWFTSSERYKGKHRNRREKDSRR